MLTRVADVEVVSGLLRQRQQRVDIAELAAGRTSNAAVIILANAIIERSGAELDALQDLLWNWQADATGANHHADPTTSYICSLDPGLLDALAATRGEAFDAGFAASVRSHEQAVGLAASKARRLVLGPQAAAALDRAEADQRMVLAVVSSWPPMPPTTN